MVREFKEKGRKTNGPKTRPPSIQIVVFRVLTSYSLEGEWKFTEKFAEFRYQSPKPQTESHNPQYHRLTLRNIFSFTDINALGKQREHIA